MSAITCLNKAFATTRMLARDTPHCCPTGQACGGLRTAGWFKRSWSAEDAGHDEPLPLVSVITPVLNGAATLDRTLQSVQTQDYPNVEHIVLDGGSTDNTMDILKEHDERLDFWRSAPDKGLYNALNQGAALCRGQIIAVLPADDALPPHAATLAVQALGQGDADFVYGQARLLDETGQEICLIRPVPREKLARAALQEMPFAHPAMFAHSKIYQTLGGFDETLRIAADQDFVLRALEAGFQGREIPEVLALVRRGGLSDSRAAARESLRVALAHGKHPLTARLRHWRSLAALTLRDLLPHRLFSLLKRMKGSRHA